MLTLTLTGFLVGLAISVPVGPIGLLCIQRSLQDGFKIGLMTGIGAALADGTYGFIVAFGLGAVSKLFIEHERIIALVGAIVLIFLGIQLFTTPPKDPHAKASDRSPWHALGTSYFLTFTNPTTVLVLVGLFTGLGLGSTVLLDFRQALLLVTSLMLGAASWWFCLSAATAFILHHRISPQILQRINRVSGTLMLIFGACIIMIQYNSSMAKWFKHLIHLG